MKIGIKLFFDMFSEEISEKSKKQCDAFGGRDEYFEYISKNCDSVEISPVRTTDSPEAVLHAAKTVNGLGLHFTIHGVLSHESVFFNPYISLLRSGLQPFYNITVHPYADMEETRRTLSAICDIAAKNSYPVRITLENQRYSSEDKLHNLCRDVAECVADIASPYLYNCFDFGHHMSNAIKQGEEFDEVTDRFLSQVRQTHIHSHDCNSTHFPLYCGMIRLEKNITDLIRHGYDEVLMIELDHNRYEGKYDFRKAVEGSIRTLKIAKYQIESKLSEEKKYKSGYADAIKDAVSFLGSDKDGLAVFAPSAYILKLGGTKIAIDMSLRTLPVKQEDRAMLSAVISECDAVIVTHNHADHFDAELLLAASEDVPVYIPDFLPFDKKGVSYVKSGTVVNVGKTEIEFFESAHSRGENIVPEYGFAVKYNNEYYIFPTDVREYEKPHKVFEGTKVLVSHLWLGRKNALYPFRNEYIEEFVAFVDSWGAERVLVGHLYDIHREIDDMWTDIHFDALKDKLTSCEKILLGDYIEF